MKETILYTIGYGTRTIADFIAILKQFNIEYLIDVRSKPYSKYNQQFNQNDLSHFLLNSGIKYVFMGDTLGGRPEDITCYNEEGKVDYLKLETKDFYQIGIERVRKAYEQNLEIVLMCSEANPTQCHRSKLISMTLMKQFGRSTFIKHIDEFGKIKDHATVMNEVNKGRNVIDLFNNDTYSTSRKSYISKQ